MDKYILGIDPSLSSTGYVLYDDDEKKVIKHGRIITKTGDELIDRITTIVEGLMDICPEDIKCVCIEDGFIGAKKALKNSMHLAMLRGAIYYAFYSKGIKTYMMLSSTTRKLVVNRGNASKEDVAKYLDSIMRKDEVFATLPPFSDANNKNKTSDIYDAMALVLAASARISEETDG